jgi:3-phosphoshikimate 1-carboxyvinyltransferase
MQYTITAPQTINATIALPASKSISNRALIIHALSCGDILPQNLSVCDDTEVIIDAMQRRPYEIDIKGAGTAMRFLTAYLAATPGEHVLTGTDRMKQRPIGILVNALRYLGADIEYLGEEGFPPLRIKGRTLEGGYIEVAGNISSQYISALLMIAPTLQNGLQLRITDGAISRPYIDLTLWMMREYGADADWSDADTITVNAKPYASREYTIESDWSAAAYWYEMLALRGNDESEVRFKGLMDASRQGDSIVKYIFSLLGVKTKFSEVEGERFPTVSIKSHPCMLPRLDYDFSSVPDLAQPVVVTCALRGIPFRFTGLATLRIKETDRIEALKRELRKLGYVLRDENGDTLVWDGTRCEPTLEPIDTYDDHRMAMAFAPAAIVFPGLRINEPQVVTKSYPQYWEDMQKAGFEVKGCCCGEMVRW